MSKRNFILLIMLVVTIIGSVLGFLLFRPKAAVPIDTGTKGTNFVSQFNPFAPNTTSQPTANNGNDSTNPQTDNGAETPKQQLTKISSMPVAGFTIFMKERLKEVATTPTTPPIETSVPVVTKKVAPVKPSLPPTEFVPALRYVASETGNIYQTFTDKISEQKFSSTIIPKIYDAYFGNHGESVVMRYLKANDRTIETFVGTLPKELLGMVERGDNEIKGAFLPDNIKDLSLSPDGSKIFYLFELGDGILGTTLNLSNNKKSQVFDSPFTEWLSSWGNNMTITLSTKPSANVPGYMYTIDDNGKNLTQVLGNINGLTTLEGPSGKLVLYGGNNLALYVYHTDTRNSDTLGVKTLPEKCVWNKLGDSIYCAVPKQIASVSYPDGWYQGQVSFNDQLWKIDLKTGNATIILDPGATNGEEIDGIKLSIDDAENYLLFLNKKDSFLWKLDLK